MLFSVHLRRRNGRLWILNESERIPLLEWMVEVEQARIRETETNSRPPGREGVGKQNRKLRGLALSNLILGRFDM